MQPQKYNSEAEGSQLCIFDLKYQNNNSTNNTAKVPQWPNIWNYIFYVQGSEIKLRGQLQAEPWLNLQTNFFFIEMQS